jgi:DNA-binding NarL/FixJ family response regulator
VIQLATVKNHVHNILEKLEVDGRAEAAAVARARRI